MNHPIYNCLQRLISVKVRTVATIMAVLLCGCAMGQAPQGIPYQAAAKSSSGATLGNTTISVRFTIHDSASTGTTLYQETFSPTTNSQGIFSVNVGMGTPVIGTFSAINWGTNAKFMQVEMDPAGGSSYVDMGTQQMMSVPYALYASSTSAITKIGFSTSTTWTCPLNVTQITVELWGGSGGGGGSSGVSESTFGCTYQYTGSVYFNGAEYILKTYNGGNGGAGGYNKSTLSVTPGLSYTITIGSGGVGGSAGLSVPAGSTSTGGNGANGGSTSFSTLLMAAGGNGGSGSISGNSFASAGSQGADGTLYNFAYPLTNYGTRSYIPSNLNTPYPSIPFGGSGGSSYSNPAGGMYCGQSWQQVGSAGTNGESGYCVITY